MRQTNRASSTVVPIALSALLATACTASAPQASHEGVPAGAGGVSGAGAPAVAGFPAEGGNWTLPNGGSPAVVGGMATGGTETEHDAAGAGSADDSWRPPAQEFPVDSVRAAKPEVIARVSGSQHNEGPAWQAGSLFWCDMGGLFRLTSGGEPDLYLANDSCGAAFPAGNGSLLLAFGGNGVAQIVGGAVLQLGRLPMGGFANDITVDAAGSIYVSNTPRGEVIRVTLAGGVSVVATELTGANGLEVDPASNFLYVNLASQDRVVKLPLSPAGLGEPEAFVADLQSPDGAAFDAWGNYWVTEFASDQIHVFDPSGVELVAIASGAKQTTNLAFGGPNNDELYVTGAGVLRRIPVGVTGFVRRPSAESYKSIGTLPFTPTP